MSILSRTQVMNNALRLIAVSGIADPNEQSEQARQVNAVYDVVVREQLETYPWLFAKRQAALPALAEAPLFRFTQAYQLPADFIRLVELDDKWVFNNPTALLADPTPPYEIQGKKLLINLPAPLNITYIYSLTDDPSLWSPLFAAVVAAAIAVLVAFPLTKSEGVVGLAEKHYQKAVRLARQSSAIQLPPTEFADGSWVMARFM